MTDHVAARSRHLVAMINANGDTVVMVKRILGLSGYDCLAGGRFADLKKGLVDFGLYLARQDPDVVIIDVSPPYAENWRFFLTLRDHPAMVGRGLVLTTTNKARLDEAVGRDSEAFEFVGQAVRS
jgi:hypothetical protein